MNEINPITTSSSTALVPVKTGSKPNFRAAALTPANSNDIDTFIKQREKEQKSAKRKQNIMTGLQAGALIAIIASVFLMMRSGGGMGKKTSELKEIWSDLGKASKLDDMALPDSLKNFISKFKNSVDNPEMLKNRD